MDPPRRRSARVASGAGSSNPANSLHLQATNKRKSADLFPPKSHSGGKKMRGGEDVSSSAPPYSTSSRSMPATRSTNKRKAAESLAPQSRSGGKKMKGEKNASASAATAPLPGTTTSSRAKKSLQPVVTLEDIRNLPQSATRPFYPRILCRGASSMKEPKPWTCPAPGCGFENGLTRHLLFNLPAFKCRACGAEPPEGAADFGFCFADLDMNEVCPIGNVKDQHGETCMTNAVTSSVEITNRVMMVILDQQPTKKGPVLDVSDLLKKYHKRSVKAGRRRCGYKYTLKSLEDMLNISVDEGIKELERTGQRSPYNKSAKVHHISDWTCIAEDDFLLISSALADAYGLVAGFFCGKRIDYLKHGEVYVPPHACRVGKKEPEGHIVVLVGAQQEKKTRFFYFLSSWDEEFCQRRLEGGDGICGGVGAVLADSLVFPPVQALRFNERYNQPIHESV